MIIDSHAHYSVFQYKNQFPFVDGKDGVLFRNHGAKKELFARMKEENIAFFIEPSVRFENLENQLSLASEYPSFIRSAVGVHPKYCLYAPWEERETIRRFAEEHHAIAIGETGLDYSIELTDEEKETQKNWFSYQLSIARELRLPLILHIRDADEAALEILNREKFPFGGVVHCFGGDLQTAKAYIALGFTLGIGGRLLQKEKDSALLKKTVQGLPLSSVLVETDAPYVPPDLSAVEASDKQKQKMRNSSLILPNVIQEIARLKDLDVSAVETSVFENTVRVFHL